MTNQLCQCGQPTSGAWLCEKCELTFRYALANVTAHNADMAIVEQKRTRYGSNAASKGSIGKAQPLPVDARFTGTKETGTQLKYDVWSTTVEWTRTVMKTQHRHHGPTCQAPCLHVTCALINRNRWPRPTVASMINYLARQFGYVLTQQWAPDMFDEFLDLERRLTYMVNRPADKWYAGRCGVTDDLEDGTTATCETELYATAEKGTIECPGCGITHDVGERREFLLKEAKDYNVTASEAASALMAWTDYDGTTKKLVDLIAYWRENDALEDHGVTEVNGQWRKVYRLGDVQDRLIGHAQREQERRLRQPKAS